MSDFKKFSAAVDLAVSNMFHAYKDSLYHVNVSKDELWDHYINSFPAGTNPMFRERTEHDCSCCKNFVKNVGGLVAIDSNGNILTVWDNPVDDVTYNTVSQAMASFIRDKAIDRVFCVSEPRYGEEKTFDNKLNINWNHFYAVIPKQRQQRHLPENYVGTRSEDMAILKRSLTEITKDAVEIVLELINQDSLYRGAEFKATVQNLKTLQQQYAKLKTDREREIFVWQKSNSGTRFRNTVIGTLLCDLSDGVDLEDAVKSFEAKVAPTNYKRPKALVTQKMIDNAQKTVENLGIEESLYRRQAKKSDISVNNVLFVDNQTRKKMLGGAFDDLKPTKTNVPEFKNVESISIKDFITNVLPSANSVELFVTNDLRNNFVTLTAPVHADAAPLFKWNNGFSWSYDGDVADSIKERVKKAGGKVDGEFRVSLSWHNADDLDLSMQLSPSQRVYFGNKRNFGCMLDVDMNAFGVMNTVDPVENIYANKLKNVVDGTYEIVVHNFNQRVKKDQGFQVEIEIDGELYSYSNLEGLSNGQRETVAILKVKNGKVEVSGKVQKGGSSFEKWNIKTESWTPVEMVMRSPNYWDDNKVGNEHIFFMLKDCKNPDSVRGFYNEFLRPDLNEHRKVFELLASKMKAEYNDEQLSGIGISVTMNKEVTVRVKGNINRVLKVVF